MGLIIKNGVEYPGGSKSAAGTSYDNSESGLDAITVQDAIDNISDNLIASDNLRFRFATDGEGNYGYLNGDDTFVPFKSGSGELHGAVISGSTSDATLFGQTVKLLKGSDEVQSATISDAGTFTFLDIEEVGSYTVSTIDTEDIPCSLTVNITSDDIVNKNVLAITLVLKYATIMGSTDETTLKGKNANLYKDSTLVKSTLIANDGTFSFKIIEAGDYEIKSTDGTKEASSSVSVSATEINNRTSKSVKIGFLAIVTFAGGTDAEITAMIEAHYNGDINISDYWSIGDKRKVHINAMSAGDSVSETHHADDYDFVIIGFNHDDLVTSVNGKTKSALTLQMDRIMYTDTTTESMTNYDTSHECGYIYSAYNSPSYSLWDGSPRRNWCNNTFYNALPTWLQALIKPVVKKTWRYCHSSYSSYSSYRTQQSTNDKVFLASEFEVYGVQGLDSSTYGTVGNDGTQYDYYKTTTNRYKKPIYTGYQSAIYWLRSSYVFSGGYSYFRCVNGDGSVGSDGAYNTCGLAPAFCI